MKILFLTNFYPPVSRGGYEQWCEEVATGLRSNGHQVVVLTSRYGKAQHVASEASWIQRDLHLEMEFASLRNSITFFTRRKAREAENLARLRQLIADFAPDCAIVWGMWNLSRALAAQAEALMPERVVYYIGDYWPILPPQYEVYWQIPARHWAMSIPKRLLGLIAKRMLRHSQQPQLIYAHALFPTVFVRNELYNKGIVPRQTRIINGAIDTSRYLSEKGFPGRGEKHITSLLYAGRLTPEKGVESAIEAVAILIRQYQIIDIELKIVGSGEQEYEEYLKRLVRNLRLNQWVTFLGAQPSNVMPEFYRQADILLFTSIWPEPFGRVLVEAMSSGTIVVGTGTGGSAEVLMDEYNGLTFRAGNSEAMAKQIARVIQSADLRQRLSEGANQTATTKFDIKRMVEEIESYLAQTVV